MMLDCFAIDKLHGFMMHGVMLAVGRISCENNNSFQFSNVGSYALVASCLDYMKKSISLFSQTYEHIVLPLLFEKHCNCTAHLMEFIIFDLLIAD